MFFIEIKLKGHAIFYAINYNKARDSRSIISKCSLNYAARKVESKNYVCDFVSKCG